ncbi:MAG: hypothetical protein QF616_00505, partial [Candidatus Marinimicrobia bacterium]|nr:hypothetical protein [Candidatus Neomarinimicrobiota bacterium]
PTEGSESLWKKQGNIHEVCLDQTLTKGLTSPTLNEIKINVSRLRNHIYFHTYGYSTGICAITDPTVSCTF